MRTTAVLNNKGGVGKTVTVVNVAAILARLHGKRVLVVDADSQGNTTEFFGGLHEGAETFATMLRRCSAGDPAVPTAVKGVDLIGADDSLMDLDLSSIKSGSSDPNCLKSYLQQHAARWDFVLVDCPPAFNAAAAAALLAADDVVIPVKLDAFSLRGMANLTRQVRNMARINAQLRVAGVLPTMWRAEDAIKDAERKLRESDLPVYPHIRASSKVDVSTFRQRPLIYSSPTSAATVDYKRFVTRYLAQGGEQHGGL